MPRIKPHPSARSRSRGPTGQSATPPAAGPPPEDEVKGPREVVEQAVRDIKAGILDTERRRIPDDVPGPREEQPQRTKGARVPRKGVDRHR